MPKPSRRLKRKKDEEDAKKKNESMKKKRANPKPKSAAINAPSVTSVAQSSVTHQQAENSGSVIKKLAASIGGLDDGDLILNDEQTRILQSIASSAGRPRGDEAGPKERLERESQGPGGREEEDIEKRRVEEEEESDDQEEEEDPAFEVDEDHDDIECSAGIGYGESDGEREIKVNKAVLSRRNVRASGSRTDGVARNTRTAVTTTPTEQTGQALSSLREDSSAIKEAPSTDSRQARNAPLTPIPHTSLRQEGNLPVQTQSALPENVPQSKDTQSVLPVSRARQQDGSVLDVDAEDRASTANNQGVDLDSSVLLHIIRSHKAELMDFLKDAINELKEEIRKPSHKLNTLNEEVVELGGIVVTAANAMVGKQGNHSVKPKEVQRALCIVPAIFTEKVICTVMAKVLISFCENEIEKQEVSRKEKVGFNLLEVMFFSKLRTEKKREKFATELGKKYSAFRHGVLLSCIMAMQDNAFATFITKRERDTEKIISVEPEVSRQSSLFSSKAVRPAWLEPDYINQLHCETAAARAERRGTDEPGNDRVDTESSLTREFSQNSNLTEERNPRSNEGAAFRGKSHKNRQNTHNIKDIIAVEAAGLVYKAITNVLHKARDATKIQLFHEGLYVFTGWSQYSSKVQQSSLKLSWLEDQAHVISRINHFPSMTELHVLEKYNYCRLKADNVNETNMKNLRTFLKEHPEMFLVVEHDVVVSGKTRNLRYYVNVIEVVAKLLASFTSVGTNGQTEDILNAHKASLKVVIVMSIGLRALINRTMQDRNSDGTVMWMDLVMEGQKTSSTSPLSSSTSDYSLPKVDGVSLEHFQPPRSKQKEIIGPLLLTLKEAEYFEKNRGMTPRVDPSSNDSLDGVPKSTDDRLVDKSIYSIEENSNLAVITFC